MLKTSSTTTRGQAVLDPHRRSLSNKLSDDSAVGKCSPKSSTSAVSTIGPLPTRPPRSSARSKLALDPARASVPCVPQLEPPIELAVSFPTSTRANASTQSRRASKRIEQWLHETQHRGTHSTFADDLEKAERVAKAAGTPCNPYLAYPSISAHAPRLPDKQEEVSRLGNSFAIVDENHRSRKSREGVRAVPQNTLQASSDDLLPPSAPFASSNQSLRAPRPTSILSISSLRKLPFAAKTLPSKRSVSSPAEVQDLTSPPQTIKKQPITRRRSPIPEEFLNTDPAAASATTMEHRSTPRTRKHSTLSTPKTPESQRTSTMRKRLGNLLRGHTGGEHYATTHASPSSSSKHSNSPRPSTSNSSATAVDNEVRSSTSASPRTNVSAPKFSINLSDAAFSPMDDFSSPARSSFSHEERYAVPSLAPLVFPSHPPAAGTDPSSPARGLSKRASQTLIFNSKKHNVSSSALSTLSIGSIGSLATNSGSMFNGSSSAARQKRLVVSGIRLDDAAAIQGLKRWCERFGEIRQITRMPNGDLYVDFKRADVADTVCRLSARVFIAGVGSVTMSWTTGKKR